MIYKKVLILGPRIECSDALKKELSDLGVYIIGDGKRALTDGEWDSLKGKIDSTSSIMIHTHGGISYRGLVLETQVDPSLISRTERAYTILSKLNKASEGKPLVVGLNGCFVGTGADDVTALPGGSTLIMYGPKEDCTYTHLSHSIILRHFSHIKEGEQNVLQSLLDDLPHYFANGELSISSHVSYKPFALRLKPDASSVTLGDRSYLANTANEIKNLHKNIQEYLEAPIPDRIDFRIISNDGFGHFNLSELQEWAAAKRDDQNIMNFNKELQVRAFSKDDELELLKKVLVSNNLNNDDEFIPLINNIGGNLDVIHDVCGQIAQDAIYRHNLDNLSALMKKGLSANEKYNGAPLLYIATQYGHVEVVKFLLENGANLNGKYHEYSSLYLAAYKGYANIVELLLKNGAHPNEKCYGKTPLEIAVEKNHPVCVKAFTEYLQNQIDHSLLDKAISLNYLEVYGVLAEHYCNELHKFDYCF